MSDDRPPVTDAEYRLVRGPWPRWSYNLSLLSLALWTAAVVFGCMLAGVAVYYLLKGGLDG
jgi:hypothetical protein